MTPQPALDIPSAPEIAQIAAQSDIVMRNLWITWTYYRLNQAMKTRLGGDNFSWSGFAVWASKTAGRYIRGDECGPLIEEWVESATSKAGPAAALLAHAIGAHDDPSDPAAQKSPISLRGFAREVLSGVAAALADGNRVVFADIGPRFAGLIALWNQFPEKVPDAEKTRFLDSCGGGLNTDYLTPAFTLLLSAAETSDSRLRAQQILYANVLVGCDEQTRLQPSIAASMNCAVADLFAQRLDTHLRSKFPESVAREMSAALRPLCTALEAAFQTVSTKVLMEMSVPGQVLHLGEDVPPPPGGPLYPDCLAALDDPQPLQLFSQFHATQCQGSGARDWVSFPERMRYIAVLFRSRQQVPALWEPPFTDAQVAALKAGQLPSPPL